MLHALAIEDDERHAALLASALRPVAWVQHVPHADEALSLLGWVVPDVVIADCRGTSSASPMELAASLRIALDRAGDRARTRVPLVLVSGMDPDVLRSIADTLRDTHALPKPYSSLALRELVATLTAPRRGAHPEG